MLLTALLALLAFQDAPTFTSAVSLVHVDVEVLQGDRIVGDLRQQDFRVLDNGKVQPVLDFGRDEVPLDLVLLLDVSPSMRPTLDAVAQGVDAALQQLRPGDRVAVMAFEHPVLLDFTEDFAQVSPAIPDALRASSMSHLQRAASDAAQYLLKQPRSQRRRCILMITDNRGSSRTTRALSDLWEADATLSGLVVLSPSHSVMFTVVQPQTLFMGGIGGLVEKSGGDIVNLGTKIEQTADGLRRIIGRLRSRYNLHYALPQTAAGQRRSIKVELTKDAATRYPKAKIRARQGYVSPPQAASAAE